jgi:hypothetical protein
LWASKPASQQLSQQAKPSKHTRFEKDCNAHIFRTIWSVCCDQEFDTLKKIYEKAWAFIAIELLHVV